VIYQPRNAMACVLADDRFRRHPQGRIRASDVIIPYGDVSVDNPRVWLIQKFFDAGFKGIKMHRPKNNWDDHGYFRSTKGCNR
jgi:hypothetical protein